MATTTRKDTSICTIASAALKETIHTARSAHCWKTVQQTVHRRLIIDTSGDVENRYTYKPFGELFDQSGHLSATSLIS